MKEKAKILGWQPGKMKKAEWKRDGEEIISRYW